MRNRIFDNQIKTSIFIVGIFAILLLSVGFFWDSLTLNIFPNTVIGIYEKSFWTNLVTGLHGVLIDLVLVAILIFWLDQRRDIKSLNQKFTEELEDYAKLDYEKNKFKEIRTFKKAE